ncbi:MAG TPA: MOSC domain-containing protein [Gemmatimonadaceae bacterium]|nr:MOSC domain-containing protein [Gemmatimonadaceae bacterium]
MNGVALDNDRIGTLASINISNGGVPKKPISGAQLSRSSVVDDAQNDQKHHGGPERAVCIYSLERIRALQDEGHPIDIGTVGENLTLAGIDWDLVVPGARLQVGTDVLLEVASFTNPCKTIKHSFIDGKFTRIADKLHPGWSRVYARVLAEGQIRSGDRVELTFPPR